ncbi:hypothetical protein GCM10010303_54930 [Streptomyces purpurascens]|nr:hypothetical protein GCM10010303_54930 [Streptomyces purpurascens]
MSGGTNSTGSTPHLPDATDARSAAHEGITSLTAPRTALRAPPVRHPDPLTFGMKAKAPYWPPF